MWFRLRNRPAVHQGLSQSEINHKMALGPIGVSSIFSVQQRFPASLHVHFIVYKSSSGKKEQVWSFYACRTADLQTSAVQQRLTCSFFHCLIQIQLLDASTRYHSITSILFPVPLVLLSVKAVPRTRPGALSQADPRLVDVQQARLSAVIALPHEASLERRECVSGWEGDGAKVLYVS